MKKKYILICLLLVLVIFATLYKIFYKNNDNSKKITTLYVAVSDDIGSYINDKNISSVLLKKYNLRVVYDKWDNNKIISKPLIRENVSDSYKKDLSYIEDDENNDINSDKSTKYDALLISEERYFNYYQNNPNKKNGEADRYKILDSLNIANSPLVIYSWKDIVNYLINDNIVTNKDGVYYLVDSNKLFNYILNSKKWSDIGLTSLPRNINISSTDPTLSSTGASYYELLLSILCNKNINEHNIDNNLKKLSLFYQKSGYMNNTSTGLFDRYLKTGIGGEAMIVDYEKSIIDFANINPTGFDEIKDQIVILYPTPTIINSNYLGSFNQNGQKLIEAFKDEEIRNILWEKYGYRNNDNLAISNNLNIGVANQIDDVVNNLDMIYYNRLIEYLSK